MMYVFFFFKQKTAYEMRISDWSSDVCSSDLQFGNREAVVSLDQAKIVERQARHVESLLPCARRALECDGIAPAKRHDVVDMAARPKAHGPLQLRGILLIGKNNGGGAELGRASWRERVCQDE